MLIYNINIIYEGVLYTCHKFTTKHSKRLQALEQTLWKLSVSMHSESYISVRRTSIRHIKCFTVI